MKIGLIDLDSKIPNLALMKLSTFHKSQGDTVTLNSFNPSEVDKVYCSVLFKRNKEKAALLSSLYSDIAFGGTGWDLTTVLPAAVENQKPDYDLYTTEILCGRMRGIGTRATKMKKAKIIAEAGIGFTTRGCVRSCEFCVIGEKEGKLRSVGSIADLVNPRSNVVIILDNNFIADPDVLEKIREIKERKLVVDITQGLDIRLMTPELAKALSEIKHLRSIHYAWDLMSFESIVLRGIDTLSRHIKTWRHLCYMLVGFNTSFEEDMYRFRKLLELRVDPFVMVYNEAGSPMLHHFARWVNGRIYTKCGFEDYKPWIRDRVKTSFFDEQMACEVMA